MRWSATNIRYRDGSFGFFNNTDLNGYAGFNEVFPLLNWLVVETDSTRYKNTGTHVVYDAGGRSTARAAERNRAAARSQHRRAAGEHRRAVVPAARASCAVSGADADCATTRSDCACCGDTSWRLRSERHDRMRLASTADALGPTEGWQGLLGPEQFHGIRQEAVRSPGENGGINGHVIYASTRPFDDPPLSLQPQWEPGVPHVTINLYQEGLSLTASTSLTLVDTTKTSSFDDWAQGFRPTPPAT